MEIFKDVQGYENLYQVSNYGRVKSLPRWRTWGNRTFLTKERFLKQRLHDGYLRVNLCITGEKMVTKNVHLLVINSFVEKVDGKNFANHIDSDRTNCHYTNLEWVNERENRTHGVINGGIKSSKYPNVGKSKTGFVARIKVNRKLVHLGVYQDEELAFERVLQYVKENNIENKYLNV